MPPPTRALDRTSFVTSVSVVDWDDGDTANPIAITVQTRVSKLYERLFAALGDFAPAVEFFVVRGHLFCSHRTGCAIIGTQLTRTVTGAVAQLYEGTSTSIAATSATAFR